MTDIQAQAPNPRRKPEDRDRQLAGMGVAAIVGAAAAHLASKHFGGGEQEMTAASDTPRESLDVFDALLATDAAGAAPALATPVDAALAPSYPTGDGEYRAPAGANVATEAAPVAAQPSIAESAGPAGADAPPPPTTQGPPPARGDAAAIETQAGTASQPEGGDGTAVPDPPTNGRAATVPEATGPVNNGVTDAVPPAVEGTAPPAGNGQGSVTAPPTAEVDPGAQPPVNEPENGAGSTADAYPVTPPLDQGGATTSPPPDDDAPFSYDFELPENAVIARLSPMDLYDLVRRGQLDELMAESLTAAGIPVTAETQLGLFNAVAPLAVARRYDGDGDETLDLAEAQMVIKDIGTSQSFNDWYVPQGDNAPDPGNDYPADAQTFSIEETYAEFSNDSLAGGGALGWDEVGAWATARAADVVVHRYDRDGDGTLSGHEAFLLCVEARRYPSQAAWSAAITSGEPLLSDYVLPTAGSVIYAAGPRLDPETFMAVGRAGLLFYQPVNADAAPWHGWIYDHAPQEIVDAYAGTDGTLSAAELRALATDVREAGWDYGQWQESYGETPPYSAEALYRIVSTGRWVDEVAMYSKIGPTPDGFTQWLMDFSDPAIVARYDRDGDGYLSVMEAELLKRELVSYSSPVEYGAAVRSPETLASEHVQPPYGTFLQGRLDLDTYIEIETRGLIAVNPDEPNGFTADWRAEWLSWRAPEEVVAAYGGPDGAIDAAETDQMMEARQSMGMAAWAAHLRTYAADADANADAAPPSADSDEPPLAGDDGGADAAPSEAFFSSFSHLSDDGGWEEEDFQRAQGASQEVAARFDRDGNGLSTGEARDMILSVLAAEGDFGLWQSALQNSPLPGHNRQLSMEEVYESLRHKQFDAIVDRWQESRGNDLRPLLPAELIMAIDPEGTGQYDLAVLEPAGARVEDGMSFAAFEDAIIRLASASTDEAPPDSEESQATVEPDETDRGGFLRSELNDDDDESEDGM